MAMGKRAQVLEWARGGGGSIGGGGGRGSPTPQPLSLGPRPTHTAIMSPEELFWLFSNTKKSFTVTVEKGCPLPTTSRPSMSSERPRKER